MKGADTTKIVLADDHNLVRQGLRALLEAQADFEVVGEAAEGLGVADLVARLEPDVLVVDLMMPGLCGLDVARAVGRATPKTRVIVLSMHADEAYVLEALRNGAVGYVLKDSQAGELVAAVRAVVAGRRFLSGPITELAIEAYVQRATAKPLDPYDALTGREREIFHLVAEGHTSGEIATRLNIGARTADTHRANFMHKLGLRTQTDVVRYALRRGVISMDP